MNVSIPRFPFSMHPSVWPLMLLLAVSAWTPVRNAWAVTIAYPIDIPPLFYQTPAGDPNGLGIDIWRLWSRKTGIPAEFVGAPFQETADMVRDGRADIHAGLLDAGDRRSFLEFAAPLFEVEANFFHRQNLSGLNELNDLLPFRIGVRRGTICESFLRERLPGASLIPFDAADELTRALEQGEIRVFMMSTPDALSHLRKANLRDQFQYPVHQPLLVLSAWAAVAGGREDLAESVRKGMARITSAERAEIDRRWLGEVSVNPGDVLVVAMDRDFPPFSFLDADGEPSGLLVDIWRLWSRKTGAPVSFRTGSWEQTLEWLERGEADVHSGLFVTPGREAWIAFSQPFYGMSVRLFHPAGADSPAPPKRVAAVSGSHQAEWLRNRRPEVQVVEFSFLEEAFRAAEDGLADAVLAEAPSARAILNRMGRSGAFTSQGPALYRRELHAGALRGNADLAEQVDRGLTAIYNDELARIERRWIDGPRDRHYTERSGVVRLTRDEEAWLRKHPTLRVRLRADWPPLSEIDQNGDASGIYAEYLGLLEQRLGVRFDVVEMPCDAVDEAARNRTIDLFPGRLLPGRGGHLRFTRGFLEQPVVLINRVQTLFIRGLDDLAGKQVTFSPDCGVGRYLVDDYPGVNFVEAENDLAALEKVADGSADAFLGDLRSATYRIQKHHLPNLKIAVPTGYQDAPIRFAVRSDWPVLVDILNKALDSVTPAEHEAIRRRWAAVELNRWIDWPLALQAIAMLGVGFTVVWGIFLFWNRRLGAEVAERKRVEKALAQSRNFLKTLIDDLPIAVFAKDAESGRFTLWNRAAESLFGVSANDALGRTDFDLFPVEQARFFAQKDRETLWAGVRTVIDEEPVDSPRLGRRMVRTTKAPVRGNGTARPYLLCISEDITERRRHHEELNAAKEAAESASRAKSDFLARMSHEIRTPMNAIIGMTQLALHTDLTDAQRDYLNKIHQSAHSLLGIINDILDFSRIEAGKLTLESVDFALEEILEKVMNLNGLAAERKEIELLLSADPDVPDRLRGDPLRLEQVLNNLVSNAVKFSESGEVVLSARRLADEGARLRLEFVVRDTGIGMDEGQMSRLFESFSQADESTTRRFGGSGLGLAICKRLVEMLDGQIGVESAPGEGSAFTFSASFARAEEEKPPRSMALPPEARDNPVLVADDNAASRRILGEALRRFGFRPMLVDSGVAALIALRGAPPDDPFRLILVDWKMPGMDGLETACRIKEDDGLSRAVTVVMVSAYGRDSLSHRPDSWCIDGFLAKPISPSALYDLLQNLFGRAESSQLPSAKALAPAAQPAANPQKRTRSPKGNAAGEGLQGLRVLLAEDNEINQAVAVGLLKLSGVETAVAENGRLALDKLRSAPPGTFDLVLMDLQMPEMDGYQATRSIRKDPRFDSLPILAMTAHAMTGEREKCLDAGMNDHLTKPVDQEKLLSALARWTGRVAGTSAGSMAAGASERLPHLPGVDREAGLAVVAGNQRIYRELLVRFVQDHAEASRAIRAELDGGDRAVAVRLAHTLKGAAANVGALRVEAAAGELERRLLKPEAEPSDALANALAGFERALSAVTRGIRAAGLADSESEDVCARVTPLSATELASGLDRLGELLSEDDMEAVDLFEALGTRLRCAAEGEFRETVDRMGTAIRAFEFDDARECLAGLRSRGRREKKEEMG
ncbi:MAG: transporter substrate-binding domain-containing protein [Desulfococcaceae bacterium]